MNGNTTSIGSYVMSFITVVISLFRPEEWMVIGIVVGILSAIFTAVVNYFFRAKEHRLRREEHQMRERYYRRHLHSNEHSGEQP